MCPQIFPGIKRTFDVPDAVRGSALTCKAV